MSYIGVYDSGLGGLSVLRHIQAQLPHHDLCYLADSAFCPYGSRSTEEVRRRALACTTWLINHGAEVIVVACNRATSDAVDMLRERVAFPIVGMEPGVKPAIKATRTRQIGVLATGGTLEGERFASLVERFGGGVQVQTIACPDLVTQVEAGDLDSPFTRHLLAGYLAPLQARGVDVIVLGCTHFPFLAPTIANIVGPAVTLIDTGPAVARQVLRVATAAGIAPGDGSLRCATTGAPRDVAPVVTRLLRTEVVVEQAKV